MVIFISKGIKVNSQNYSFPEGSKQKSYTEQYYFILISFLKDDTDDGYVCKVMIN